MFGLLGITILGAMLSARQRTAAGAPLHRFLERKTGTGINAKDDLAVGAASTG